MALEDLYVFGRRLEALRGEEEPLGAFWEASRTG